MSQGLHVGQCRQSCLRAMHVQMRLEDRRYRKAVRACAGDKKCLEAAEALYETCMVELEKDSRACIEACK